MEYFNIVFPAILTLLGVWIGNYITGRNQKNIQNTELEDIKRREFHTILKEQMIVYNEYLEVKVNHNILIREGDNDYFDFSNYLTKYRPVFSNKIHLLDEKVVHWILSIDKHLEITKLVEGELNKKLDKEIHNELIIWFASLDFEVMSQLGAYKEKVIEGYYQYSKK